MVVHLDLDVLILQPLDSLVDTIIQGERSSQGKNIKVQWPDKPIPDRVNAFFTRDCKNIDRVPLSCSLSPLKCQRHTHIRLSPFAFAQTIWQDQAPNTLLCKGGS